MVTEPLGVDFFNDDHVSSRTLIDKKISNLANSDHHN